MALKQRRRAGRRRRPPAWRSAAAARSRCTATACRRRPRTYIGLVEVGVGLIPAGGGTKEMLARAMEDAPAGADPLPYVQRVFETIGFGKVSTSAPDAQAARLPARRRRHHDEPRAAASPTRRRRRSRARRATSPAQPRTAIRVGGEGVLAALKLGVHLAWRAGRISDHDALIGRKLAWILAGGNLPHAGDADRAAAARPRARGVPEPVRRAQDAGTHRAHAENGEDAEELITRIADRNREGWMRRRQQRASVAVSHASGTGCGARGERDRDDPVIYDQGSGPPVIVVPGVQGRWEWMRPAWTR